MPRLEHRKLIKTMLQLQFKLLFLKKTRQIQNNYFFKKKDFLPLLEKKKTLKKKKICQLIFNKKVNLELAEGLGSTLSLGDLEDVETNGLGKRTTLTNGNEVTTKIREES